MKKLITAFDIIPIPKPRMNKSDAWRGRKCVAEYWKFKDELIIQAKKMGFKIGNKIHIICYMPVPASWSEKKKQKMIGEPHLQKPDCDNLLKAFQDCLTDDDSKIYDARCEKYWSAIPRIEVVVNTFL